MTLKPYLLAASLLAAVHAHAAIIENFDSYNVGPFTNPNWTKTAGSWDVVQDGANKVLKMTGAADATLFYTTEPFSAAGTGYSVDVKIKYTWGDSQLSQYSGFRFDEQSTSATDPGTLAYTSRRFSFENVGWVYTAWAQQHGAGVSFAKDTWYYLHMERTNATAASSNGGDLKIWASTSPISGGNPGIQIFNLSGAAVPDVNGYVAATNLFGLFGAVNGTDAVYFDDILVAAPPLVPEPASVGLLLVGALALWRRRQAKP
jgi:hypothetical protein